VTRVVAGGVIDHRSRLDLPGCAPVDGERPACGDAGLLASPHLPAPVRAARFDARVFAQEQIEQHVGVVHAHAALAELDRSVSGKQARSLAQLTAGPRQERPERLPGGSDLHDRRAGHQLLAEDAHVAPALQRPATAEQAHASTG
jgi:hypothetical protein